MIASTIGSSIRLCRLGWLTGPIFDKELRVASRRRRNYWLRLLYVLLLTLFLAGTWVPVAAVPGSVALFQTQSQVVAKTITRGVIWFQFFGAQLVALVMMSTAISDEVYGRTLNVLMTTPLSSVQVVLGKLLGRLLQILLLVTPLRDRDILIGKFAGFVRRCGPMWLPLVAYVVVFTLASVFHPLAVVHILALSLGMLFFLGCTGMYLSSRIGRTTTAGVVHLALAGGLWLIMPIGATVVTMTLDQMGMIHADAQRILEDAFKFVPFTQGFLLIDPLATDSVSGFRWAGFRDASGFLFMLIVVTGSYVLAGLPFAARAMKAFRRTTLDDRV